MRKSREVKPLLNFRIQVKPLNGKPDDYKMMFAHAMDAQIYALHRHGIGKIRVMPVCAN